MSPSSTHGQIWAPEFETLERDSLRSVQTQRLREQVKHVYENSAFFRELYDENDIHPTDIREWDDLRRLPTFDKDDLRAYRDRTGDFWCGALCVPESQLVWATQSTGTTGKPNFFGLTEDDYDTLGDLFAREAYAWGLRKGDTINSMGTALWNGAMAGLEQGVRRVGATPVRSIFGTQNLAEVVFGLQAEADFDALVAYQPEQEKSYMEENNIDPGELFPSLRFVCSSTDASKPKRELFEEVYGVPFRNAYASGDQFFTSYECGEDGAFCHVPEDLFIVEVLDPETREPVESGEYGEVFITNLWAEANPYIRYRLEDLVEVNRSQCSCGRTTMRIRPLGRLSWSVEVAGYDRPVTSIDVEEILWSYDALYGENYQMVKHQPGVQDELHVRVAMEGDITEDVEQKVTGDLEETFGVPARFTKTEPGDIGLESATKIERVAEEF
jgi:phenylacetate-CoA ligase